jgi:hypothetical protein
MWKQNTNLRRKAIISILAAFSLFLIVGGLTSCGENDQQSQQNQQNNQTVQQTSRSERGQVKRDTRINENIQSDSN